MASGYTIFGSLTLRPIILIPMLLLALGASAQQPVASAAPLQETPDRWVKLYPNPAVSYITFDLRENFKRGFTLQVYSAILGKKVFELPLAQDKTVLSLNEFSRGLYIYHLTDANGKIIESGKFQVSK